MARARRDKFDAPVEEWLTAQKKSSESSYAYRWKFFLEFTGKTGAEILASRQIDKDFFWEKKTLDFKTWMLEEKKAAPYTAKAATTAVRSFFTYYRLGLVFRRQEKTSLKKSSRVTEDYHFQLDDFAKMVTVSDLEEKYIVTAGKSFGLRAGDFLRVKRGDLAPYIDRDPPISIGEFSTEKEDVKAFPFIDADAKPIIKLLLEKMDREGRTAPSDKMLIYKDDAQLSRILRRTVEKAGIKVGDKEVRFHLLRKFLSDHLSSHMSESKWKQIVGKQISEGAYISPDSLREDYARAMPETCFSYQKSADIEKLAKKQALLAMTKAWGMSEVELKALFRRPPTTTDEEIEEMERIVAERSKLRENVQTAAGGLSFQEKAAETFAEIITKALEKVAAKQEKKTWA